MTKVHVGLVATLLLLSGVATAQAAPIGITVDCDKGQSLNQALSKLDKHTPATLSVNGTCSEYVGVIGFENLTLKGLPGATLQQPSSGGNLFNAVLLIESSRSVMVNGLRVQADSTVSAIGIGHGSTDIRLRYLNVTGGGIGIIVFENSQASLAYVNGQAPGYATLAIYDSSDVHLEHSNFVAAANAVWNVGIALGASHVTMYDTTITNMQVGIGAAQGSVIDLVVFNTYYPLGGPTDVKILNPAGTSVNGVQADGSGSLNLNSARLLIDRAGQSWAGTTGGVLLSNGATLNGANGNLIITNSLAQGVIALNNAHATLAGVTISGSAHAGLVAANLSSIDVAAGSQLSSIFANSIDLFCDSTSWVTGTANISGKPTAQCTNLLTSETVAFP